MTTSQGAPPPNPRCQLTGQANDFALIKSNPRELIEPTGAAESGTLPTGGDWFSASCLGITPLGPKDAGGPGLLADTGAFPVLGVRLDSRPRPPRLGRMSVELTRNRLAAERASFIEPCLPSPADKRPINAGTSVPSGDALGGWIDRGWSRHRPG